VGNLLWLRLVLGSKVGQCIDTVGWVSGRASCPEKCCIIYPKDSHSEQLEEENRGQMVNPCSPGKWRLTAVCVCTLQKALIEQMKSKAKEGTLKTVNGSVGSQAPAKRRRWDVSSVGPADETPHKQAKSSWDAVEAHTPSQSRWDDTPGRAKGGETPGATPGASTRQWDQTPGHASSGAVTPGRETPGQQVTPSARRNRWDETPKTDRGSFLITHLRLFTVTGVAKIWAVGRCVSQRGAATLWPITLPNAD